MTEKEKNKEALDIDLYAAAWMLKRKNKLTPDIADHVHVKSSNSFGFSLHMVEKWRQVYCLLDYYHP